MSWIDDAIGTDADAPFVFTADLVANPHPLWQTEFWNRSVGDVYGLDVVDPTGFRPYGRRSTHEAASSRSTTVGVHCRRVTSSHNPSSASQGRGSPARIASCSTAFAARFASTRGSTVFLPTVGLGRARPIRTTPSGGTVRVDVGRAGWNGPDVPSGVTIDVEHLDSGRRISSVRWVVHSGQKRTFRLSTPAAPFRVKIGVERTFSPADYGSADTRELGVQLAFAFQRRAPTWAGDPSSEHPSEQTADADAVTSELWGKTAREKSETEEWKRYYWQSHPLTLRHINRLITGSEQEDWLGFTKRRFFPEPVERGLSLGCGHGTVERDAIALGISRTFDGLDISEEALEVAARDAEQAGLADSIAYRTADLNTVELEPAAYDVVFAVQALHHVDALEHLLDEVAASLRPGGLFVVNEYIGPARFQWLDKTQAVMNRILDLLPESYRVNPRNGLVKEHIERAPRRGDRPGRSVGVDPLRRDSGAARSRFDVVYRADFGGTINQFLLADIAANFDADDPKDVAMLDLISLLEELLVAERVLPSDFAYFVLSGRS